MSWVVVGVAGTTAVLGAINAAEQRKAQQKANQQNANIAAAQQEFSPWTGIKPASPQMQAVDSSATAGAAQGALSGAMTGLQVKKGMAEADKMKAEADAAQKAQEQQAQQAGMQNMMAGSGDAELERRKKMMSGLA